MGKTYRNSQLDKKYGCFEDFYKKYRSGAWKLRATEDMIAEDKIYLKAEWWSRRTRDGRSYIGNNASFGKHRKSFKKLCKKHRRLETKIAINENMKSRDWDNTNYVTDKDGKQFIWSVW